MDVAASLFVQRMTKLVFEFLRCANSYSRQAASSFACLANLHISLSSPNQHFFFFDGSWEKGLSVWLFGILEGM